MICSCDDGKEVLKGKGGLVLCLKWQQDELVSVLVFFC